MQQRRRRQQTNKQSNNGTMAATIDTDNLLYLWSLPEGQRIQQMKAPYPPALSQTNPANLLFSPDDQFLVAVTSYNDLTVFRIDTKESLEQWLREDRFIGSITCADREQFNLLPQCNDLGTPQPTVTPYPVR